MTDFGLRAPHGPDMSGDHNPLEDMDIHEKGAFDALIRPEDSYTEDGTYWADLPFFKKIGFVSSYDSGEARKELGTIGRMIKKDPLSPVSYYFRNMVLPGAGLGLEGYVTPLLQWLSASNTDIGTVMCCSRSETSSRSSRRPLHRAGKPMRFAMRAGFMPSITWRFSVSSLARSWLGFWVTGRNLRELLMMHPLTITGLDEDGV